MIEHDDARLLLGAYVLGGLPDEDRQEIEQHLTDCAPCRAELTELMPVPVLLSKLPDDAPDGPRGSHTEAPDPALAELLLGLETRIRARRRTRTIIGAAALVVALAAAGVGIILSRDSAPTQRAGPTATFVAQGGSATSGTAMLIGRPWGTSLSVTLAGLPANGPYTLTVVGPDGTTERAASWGTNSARRADLTGATSLPPQEISAMRVVDHSGQTIALAQP